MIYIKAVTDQKSNTLAKPESSKHQLNSTIWMQTSQPNTQRR